MDHSHVPNIEYCNLCAKKIQKRQKLAKCSCCNTNSHLKCNKMNNNLSTNLHNQNPHIFMCLKCNQSNLPFYDTKERNHENYNREFLASDDIKMFFKDINNLDSQNQFKDTSDILTYHLSLIVNM